MPGLQFVALFSASVFDLILSKWSDLGSADKIGSKDRWPLVEVVEQGGILVEAGLASTP